MKKLTFYGLLITLFIATTFFTAACGGGGSGSTIVPTNGTATQNAAKKLMALRSGGKAAPFLGKISGSTTTRVTRMVAGKNQKVSSVDQETVTSGDSYFEIIGFDLIELYNGHYSEYREPIEDKCYIDGKVILNITWDGGGKLDKYSTNIKGTITYVNCNDDGKTIRDGEMHINWDKLPKSDPKFLNTTWKNYSEKTDIFEVDTKEFSSNVIIEDTPEKYTEEVIFNGSLHFLINDIPTIESYNNYSFKIGAEWKTEELVNLSIDISGASSNDCFNGMLTYTTTFPIVYEYDFVNKTFPSECPVSGDITISGEGEVRIIFNEDGSVEVGDKHYDFCTDIPKENC